MKSMHKTPRIEAVFNDEEIYVGHIFEPVRYEIFDDHGDFHKVRVVIKFERYNGRCCATEDIEQALRNEFCREVTSPHDCSGQTFGGIVSDIVYKGGMYHFICSYSIDC